MADAQASGACYGNIVRVQVPPPAFKKAPGSLYESGPGAFLLPGFSCFRGFPASGGIAVSAAFAASDVSVSAHFILFLLYEVKSDGNVSP